MTNLHEALPAIVFAIYYDDLGDEVDDTWENSLRRWEERWKPALKEEHSGDCTNECHSCFRCQAEDCVRLAGLIKEGLGEEHPGRAHVAGLLQEAVGTDGSHHKQWYPEQVAKELDVALPEHDTGIAP